MTHELYQVCYRSFLEVISPTIFDYFHRREQHLVNVPDTRTYAPRDQLPIIIQQAHDDYRPVSEACSIEIGKNTRARNF